MSIFCKHQWEEKERFIYSGHALLEMEGGQMSAFVFKQMLETVKPKTTILYKCKLCEKPKTIEIEGVEKLTITGDIKYE